MNKNIIITVVIVIVVAVGSFFGGLQYEKGKLASAFPGATGFAGRQGGAGGRAGGGARAGANGGFVTGQVLTTDAQGITIKLPNGGSRIIFASTSTAVQKSTPGSLSDVAVGNMVMVQGTPNPDGSLTAQSIQIR